MSEEQQERTYTQGDLENAKAMATVQTMLAVQRDDFKAHEAEDERNFGNIHGAIRNLSEEIADIPKTMYKCRDQLEKDMHKDNLETFVTKSEFNKLSNKITYTVGAFIMVGMGLTWAVSLYINIEKLSGG